MQNISVPVEAFSHGQIKSKLWLVEKFGQWATLHMPKNSFVLNWYGSWIGLGPFMLLSNPPCGIHEINLFDLDSRALATSQRLLEYWYMEGVTMHAHARDVNDPPPFHHTDYLFVNTSCEHIQGSTWLEKIPHGAFVLLQSTNMQHPEHVNVSQNLHSFIESVSSFLEILESDAMDVKYTDSSFSRFMVFGRHR